MIILKILFSTKGTYINDNLSVGPGLYVVIVYNPSNTTETPLSFTVTTLYTPISQLFPRFESKFTELRNNSKFTNYSKIKHNLNPL